MKNIDDSEKALNFATSPVVLLRSLNNFWTKLIGSGSRDAVLNSICQSACDVLGTSHCILAVIKNAQTLVAKAFGGTRLGGYGALLNLEVPISNSPYEDIFSHSHQFSQGEAGSASLIAPELLNSYYLIFPVVNFRGEIKGVFHLYDPQSRGPKEQLRFFEIEAGRSYANLAGLAISLTNSKTSAFFRDHTEINQKALSSMNDIILYILKSKDIKSAIVGTLQKVCNLTGLDRACVYLRDPTETELYLAVHYGMTSEYVAAIDHIQFGEGFSGKVVISGQTIVTDDVSNDTRLSRVIVKKNNLKSYVCIPIPGKLHILGTLAVIGTTSRLFDKSEINLLETIAYNIGMLLEMAKLAFGNWCTRNLAPNAHNKKNALTSQEKKIVELLQEACAPKQIAGLLGISDKTVRNHISNIYKKMDVNDRSELLIKLLKA